MSEAINRENTHGRVLIVAFEGWSDAGEAASGAVKFVCDQIQAECIGTVDSEDYYEFQFNRPSISYDADLERVIEWPGTEFCIPSQAAIDANPQISKLHVLLGAEPARRWKSFTDEILEMITDRDIDLVVFLGGMPADVPHTRAIGVHTTSQNAGLRQTMKVERSKYEGPIGIMSVLGVALEAAGVPTMAIWASVPHYVHNTPSPKATLALLIELEKLLGFEFEHGSLADDAFTWEREIDEIAENNDELAGYIEQLEKTRDAMESEAASGDALAMEFEKYLRSSEEPDDKKN